MYLSEDMGTQAKAVVTRPRSDVTTINGTPAFLKTHSVVTRPRSDVTTITTCMSYQAST